MRTARGRLAVRAGLLWVLGVLLIATGVPVYVILPAYALMFLLALPLTSLPARVLLPLAGALAVIMPFVQIVLDAPLFWSTPAGNAVSLGLGWHYPFTTWIAFVVAGLGVARADVTRLRTQVWLVVAGACLAAGRLRNGCRHRRRSRSRGGARTSGRCGRLGRTPRGCSRSSGPAASRSPCSAPACSLCRTVLVWVVLPLRAVGAMPLTAYTLQLVVWAADRRRGARPRRRPHRLPRARAVLAAHDRHHRPVHRVGAARRARPARDGAGSPRRSRLVTADRARAADALQPSAESAAVARPERVRALPSVGWSR